MGEGINVPQIRVSDGPNDFSPTLDSPLEQWGAATGRPRSSESEGMSDFRLHLGTRRRSPCKGLPSRDARSALILERMQED